MLTSNKKNKTGNGSSHKYRKGMRTGSHSSQNDMYTDVENVVCKKNTPTVACNKTSLRGGLFPRCNSNS